MYPFHFHIKDNNTDEFLYSKTGDGIVCIDAIGIQLCFLYYHGIWKHCNHQHKQSIPTAHKLLTDEGLLCRTKVLHWPFENNISWILCGIELLACLPWLVVIHMDEVNVSMQVCMLTVIFYWILNLESKFRNISCSNVGFIIEVRDSAPVYVYFRQHLRLILLHIFFTFLNQNWREWTMFEWMLIGQFGKSVTFPLRILWGRYLFHLPKMAQRLV